LLRFVRERDPAPPFGPVFVIAWAGLRGIVSLAAALALPTDFPQRDLVILMTFAVILVTLVVQGLSLPAILKFLALSDDGAEEREELRARHEAVHAAISRLDALVALGEARAEAVRRVHDDLRRQARWISSQLNGGENGADDDVELVCETELQAEREAIDAQHRMLVKLRDDGVIGDEVLRRVQAELDHEESRLT
jgi:CPA1 family monovalent cation:H+ antiporter